MTGKGWAVKPRVTVVGESTLIHGERRLKRPDEFLVTMVPAMFNLYLYHSIRVRCHQTFSCPYNTMIGHLREKLTEYSVGVSNIHQNNAKDKTKMYNSKLYICCTLSCEL